MSWVLTLMAMLDAASCEKLLLKCC